MFAVAAPMLPAPDLSLVAMGSRVDAVCVGFTVATGLFGLLSCLTAFPRAETKKMTAVNWRLFSSTTT
jgi:hypothetical protein